MSKVAKNTNFKKVGQSRTHSVRPAGGWPPQRGGGRKVRFYLRYYEQPSFEDGKARLLTARPFAGLFLKKRVFWLLFLRKKSNIIKYHTE